jgi:toxin ParE1/3/4
VKRKPVILRAQAEQDIQQAVDYYFDEGAEQAGQRFVNALERAFTQISSHPAAGSPRYAHELNLPGLRHWPVKRFPYLVFYVELDEHVDVWRVLHAQRDIPSWMPGGG